MTTENAPERTGGLTFHEVVTPPVTGAVTIEIRKVLPDGTKELVRTLQFHNIIVDNFRTEILSLLGGVGLAARAIAAIRFGVGVVAEDHADTAITNPTIGAVSSPTTAAVYPAAGLGINQVQFTATLASGSGNLPSGEEYTEVGLEFSATATRLAARRRFVDGGGNVVSVGKSSQFEWTVLWTLTF